MSSPSLFGAVGGAAASPFGAKPAAAATPFGAAPSGSIFGGVQAPAFGAATGSLFGAAPAAASAPATGLFGATTLTGTAQPAWGGFGVATSTAQPGALVPAAAAAPPPYLLGQESAVKELTEISNAFNPASPAYKFQYLLLNVVANPAQRVKPFNVDEIRWRQALKEAGGPNNAAQLWPVVASGFGDLLGRFQAQEAAIDEHQQRLKALGETVHRIQTRHSLELRERIAAVQAAHTELSHRLLRNARNVDALEGRLAMNIGYSRADVGREKQARLQQQLSQLEVAIAPTSAFGLHRRVEAVASVARLRLGGPATAGEVPQDLDPSSAGRLFGVLKEAAEAVRRLQEVLRNDALDVEIMRRELTPQNDLVTMALVPA